jgi:hypothetical protein
LKNFEHAVIYIDDFQHNITKLTNYLNFLVSNETAYEKHREWRKKFVLNNSLGLNKNLNKNWPCKICEWGFLKKKFETENNLFNKRNYFFLKNIDYRLINTQ